MNALIRKELRENVRWALLAMAAFGSAALLALYPKDGPYNYISNGVTICRTSFLTVTLFGSAACGLLLGLVQIIPELKRDRWASLLHRPVARGVLFRGKAAAGLLLYALATVPPFLLAVWLAATPGHFPAPFVAEMVFPGTVDVCMGAAYYFAALAIALQRGGWVGVRVLPLLAAFHATCFVLDVKFFAVAMEAAVLMSLALFTAAWGAFHQPDLLRPRPWLGQAAFLLVVIYGVNGGGDLAESFFNTVGPSPHAPFTRYELTDEGVPLRIDYGKGGVVAAVRDLAGHVVSERRYRPDRVRNHLEFLNSCTEYIGDSHGHPRWSYQESYRESSAYLWANSPYYSPRLEQWFWLVGRRVLVGVQPLQKQIFSVLGARGYGPADARVAGFAPGTSIDYIGSDAYCLWQPERARFTLLPGRQFVDLVLPAPGPIYGVTNAWSQGGSDGVSVSVVAVALGTGMAVYDTRGALVTFLPYHRPMDRWGQLSLGVNGSLDRFYLRYDPSEWIDRKTRDTMPSFLEALDRPGAVVRAYTLPPVPDAPRPPRWTTLLKQRLQSPAFYFGTMLYKAVGAAGGSTRLRNDLRGQFGRDRQLTRTISGYVALLAVALAAATLLWARRVCFPPARARAWAGFVLLFGLPGFLAFRLASDWPRLVACARCARPRPIDAGQCPHCGAGWPAPPATGIEIFDAAPPAALLNSTP